MKALAYTSFLILVLFACSKEKYSSPDLDNSSLLPNRGDYLDTVNYRTRVIAQEIAAQFQQQGKDSCHIQLLMFDSQTRMIPLLSYTGANWPVSMKVNKNGSLQFGYKRFQTEMMPLKMETDIKMLLQLNRTQDTVWLRGADGIVRTSPGDNYSIGTGLPQSNDAEISGYYVRASKKLKLQFDLMLPLPIKASILRDPNKLKI